MFDDFQKFVDGDQFKASLQEGTFYVDFKEYLMDFEGTNIALSNTAKLN